MNIHDLSPAPGSRRKAKRLGQGIASGTGKTAGKGHKGHKACTGGGVRSGFEDFKHIFYDIFDHVLSDFHITFQRSWPIVWVTTS